MQKGFSGDILGHGQPQKVIGWTRPFFSLNIFTSGLFCVKCSGDGGEFNHFISFENLKSYVNEVLHGNTPTCQLFI